MCQFFNYQGTSGADQLTRSHSLPQQTHLVPFNSMKIEWGKKSIDESAHAATWLLGIPPVDSFHSADLGSAGISWRSSLAPAGFSFPAPRRPGSPLRLPPRTVSRRSITFFNLSTHLSRVPLLNYLHFLFETIHLLFKNADGSSPLL